MNGASVKKLRLHFHGADHPPLGIQMYQSRVAALAKSIANSWDAGATKMEVTLPNDLDEHAEIVAKDNGIRMTFEDCQKPEE